MDKFQMANEHFKLERFHQLLTYGLYTAFLFITPLILPVIVSLILMSLAIIGFSIYLIKTLLHLEKRGWITGFAIVMGVPILLTAFLSTSEIVGAGIWFFPLCVFYFYCWVLRHSITDWQRDLGDGEAFKLRDKHDDELRDMMDKVNKF
jgi:hypothetical protein